MASVLRVVRFRDEICELAWRAYVRKAACKQKYRIPQGLAPPAFPTSSFSPRAGHTGLLAVAGHASLLLPLFLVLPVPSLSASSLGVSRRCHLLSEVSFSLI